MGGGASDSSVLPVYRDPWLYNAIATGRHSGGDKSPWSVLFEILVPGREEHFSDLNLRNIILTIFSLVISFTRW